MQPQPSARKPSNQNGLLSTLERIFRLSSSRKICLILITALVFIACDSDDEDSAETESVELLNQAASVGDYLILVDKESDRVLSIDVSAEEKKLALGLEIEDIAPNPYWIEAREGDSDEVLILSAGRRGVSEQATLSAMTVGDGIDIREYEIDAPFDRLLQSNDGNRALLYFGEGSGSSLYSLNEIAVVDLDEEDTDEAVVRQTIKTANDSISQIDISPRMEIGRERRTLAVALSESRVTVVDLDNADRSHTIVKLSDNTGANSVLPQQTEFSTDEQEIYVRALNSNDIFVLSLGPVENNFVTEVSQVPVGLEPSDMEVYKDGEATKLLVVSKGSKDVHIVSRSSTDEDETLSAGILPQTVTIELDSEADQISLFRVDGGDDADKNVALLYKKGSSVITLLDLNEAEIYQERNLETITLREPVLGVEEFEDDGIAMITHRSSQIDIIDLESRDVSANVRPIQVNNSLQNATFNTDSPRLWMVPPNQYFISYVDLDTGIPREDAVLLDDPIMQFVVVKGADKVVAVHEHEVCKDDDDDDDDGDMNDKSDDDDDDDEDEDCSDEPISISILDYDKPSRDEMITFSDFFIE